MKYINEYNDYEKNLLYQGDNKIKFYVASLIKDLEVKYHKDYPESTFFVHKERREIWMLDNKNTGNLYISSEHIWSKVRSLFHHKDLNLNKLVKDTVEIAFKMNVGTPVPLYLHEFSLDGNLF